MTDLECLMQIVRSLGLTDVSESRSYACHRDFVTQQNRSDGTIKRVQIGDNGRIIEFDFDPSGKSANYCVW